MCLSVPLLERESEVRGSSFAFCGVIWSLQRGRWTEGKCTRGGEAYRGRWLAVIKRWIGDDEIVERMH